MKKIFIMFIGLVLVGIGLTEYLPDLSITKQKAYLIDKASLDAPLEEALFQLSIIPSEPRPFSLQLGSYSDLSTATRQATKLQLKSPIDIVTFKDNERLWYTLLFGNYTSVSDARAMQVQLNVENDLSSSLIQRPINDTKKE